MDNIENLKPGEILDEIEHILYNISNKSGIITQQPKETVKNNLKLMFNKFEDAKLKEILLEKKANNLMHELEEEMKRLSIKHARLENFEKQVNMHFEDLIIFKNKILELFEEEKEIPKDLFTKFEKACKFIGKEIKEETMAEHDIKTELQKIVDKLAKISSHLK
ncbi:MAG: hypothetical protein ACMXX6_00460 [Candidatus Woesearchaeota archaeon]